MSRWTLVPAGDFPEPPLPVTPSRNNQRLSAVRVPGPLSKGGILHSRILARAPPAAEPRSDLPAD